MEKNMKQKKTYAERLELYNKRMSHFKTKFTPEELNRFGNRTEPKINSTVIKIVACFEYEPIY